MTLSNANGARAPIDSVRTYLVASVPVAELGARVEDVRAVLAKESFEDASHVFVLDAHRRVAGAVPVAALLSAADGASVDALLRAEAWPVVVDTTDRETAASLAIRAGVAAVPVCGEDGRFVGAVTSDSLLRILRAEHLEDLHHMAGIMGRSEEAREALAAPPWRRALFRLPWLAAGLAGSALATLLMSRFEQALSANIAVAFFVPAIVYLADAVGTQSEAVAVRGLSLTKGSLIALLASEIGTGVLIGLAIALAAWPLTYLAYGDAALASAVSCALLAASSVATSIGLALPWAFDRAGFDPALGSGPVATVIQDLLSIVIYLMMASLFVF